MEDKAYKQIKEILDASVAECRRAAQEATVASKTCAKLAALCEKIAKDLAKRGDNA